MVKLSDFFYLCINCSFLGEARFSLVGIYQDSMKNLKKIMNSYSFIIIIFYQCQSNSNHTLKALLTASLSKQSPTKLQFLSLFQSKISSITFLASIHSILQMRIVLQYPFSRGNLYSQTPPHNISKRKHSLSWKNSLRR